MSETLRIGIVGGTGYTGVELLRLLAVHPHAHVTVITSRQEEGRAVGEVFPNLRGHYDLTFSAPDADELAAQADLVFFATPHGAAMATVPDLLARGVKVIDLSADFRLRDAQVWSDWYNQAHTAPELIKEAVYGLPEWTRSQIADARLIACPGCYPTAVQLALLPLMRAGAVETQGIIADCKSGVSGAGRAAKLATLFCETADSFSAYAGAGHRHQPEIEQTLADFAGEPVDCLFQPHLVPQVRGIHASVYARGKPAGQDWQALFEQAYADEPFVDVLPAGSHPATRNVRGSNMAQIAVRERNSQVMVFCVIDNLVRGSSGQAIQCLNIMYGWPETMGLEAPALLP